MTDQPHRDRPAGETSGSPQRPAQPHGGPVLTFDLAAELEQLRAEESYRNGDRNARTLVKEPSLRIVLTALKAGARLREHRAPGPVSIQAVAGQIRLHVRDEVVDVPNGRLVSLDADVPHDVEAVDESAFLLTVAWPPGQGSEGA